MADIFEDDDVWADWFKEDKSVDNELDKTEFKYVLGLDPGGTTGLAIFRYTDETLPELVFLDHIEGGMLGYYDYFFESYLDENLVAVSEKWVSRPGVRNPDITPAYIEGVQLAQWGQNRVLYQTPDMKQMVPDQILKDQHLWVPNARHAMDATIHVLVYLRNIKHKPTLEALSGIHLETIGETDDSKDKFGGGTGDGDGAGFESALAKALAELADKGDQEGQGAGGEDDGDGPGSTPNGDVADGQPGVGGVENPDDIKNGEDRGIVLEKDDGKKRSKREKNGVFIGFDPAEEEVEELYAD